MNTTRAKFRVAGIEDQKQQDGSLYARVISLSAVTGSGPGTENQAFWKATPAGTIQLWISNPTAFEIFHGGQEFYVDFTPATMAGEQA